MAPIYMAGSPDPRTFARGKRTIAGSLIGVVFDKENLEAVLSKRNFYNTEEQDFGHMPTIDIILIGTNEYGAQSFMKILGCELMKSGYGVPINEVITDKIETITYVANKIVPWTVPDIDIEIVNPFTKRKSLL